MPFKEGDCVVFKDWDEMVDEYGIDPGSDCIDVPFMFSEPMRYLCGQVVHIKEIGVDAQTGNIEITTVEGVEGHGSEGRTWFISDAMLKPYCKQRQDLDSDLKSAWEDFMNLGEE